MTTDTIVTYVLSPDAKELVISFQAEGNKPLYMQQVVDAFFASLDEMQRDGTFDAAPDRHIPVSYHRPEELN